MSEKSGELNREISKRESKDYPPDKAGDLTREEVIEYADGTTFRQGGIEAGPDKGRRWSKWDHREPISIPDAPAEAEVWEAGQTSRVEALRAQRYGFVTAASENGSGQKVDDAWLHAEADVEELPADPFGKEDLRMLEMLSPKNPVIDETTQDWGTRYELIITGDQETVIITREFIDGSRLVRGERRTGDRSGTGWVSRDLPADARIPSVLRLPTDDGSMIGQLALKKSTFDFGPDSSRRLYLEYVGRRESAGA